MTRRELAVARALDQARSRAENRVQLFLDAALELMNSNSGEFTVQEVAERSGQSLRTFYQYFAGKHELLLALFEDSIRCGRRCTCEDVIAEGDGAARPTPSLRRRVLPDVPPQAEGPTATSAGADGGIRPAAADVASRGGGARLRATRRPARGVARRAAAAAGEIRPGLDYRRISGVVLQATMFNAFATAISGSSFELDADAEPETLWDLLLRGIGTAT